MSELGVIAQAPVSFGLALAVLTIIIWRALAWRHLGTLDSLEGRNKLQADQIADYKSKLSGASPDEAKARLDALEIQVRALSPRRLSEEQKEKFLSALGIIKGVIDITHDMAVADAKALTGDFAVTFQRAGWTVSLPAGMGIGNPPPSGIALRVRDVKVLTPVQATVKHALEAADICFDLQLGLRLPHHRPKTPAGFPTIPDEPALDAELLITTKLT